MMFDRSFYSHVVVVVLALALPCGGSVPRAQDDDDIEGSVGVFIAPPNPKVSGRKKAAVSKEKKGSTKGAKPAPTPDVNEEVEAALAEGNAARDADPPRHADAEQAYRRATTLAPRDARAFAGLGNLYFDQRRPDEAEENYRRAVELNPADGLSHVYLAYTYNRLRRPEDAGRVAARAAQLLPNDYRSHHALGLSRYGLKDYAGAEMALRRAFALSPSAREPYTTLGRVLVEQNRYRDAAPVYQKLLEFAPPEAAARAHAHVRYGSALQRAGRLDEAAAQYESALRLGAGLRPRSRGYAYAVIRPHSELGLIRYTQGDAAAARRHWETAVRLGSEQPRGGAHALGRVGLLALDGNFAAARAQLE
ncbi:MAG: tetratricopeptide repeat protein, partial [Pyrinomonadaceae bacterium]